MQSARSGLALAGSTIVGRLSDRFGRKPVLMIGAASSCLSLLINYQTHSLKGMWYALIPASLLNQNYTVFKALFADYNIDVGGSEADRAKSLGFLGMAVGLSFMIGPISSAFFFSDYTEATFFAIALTSISALCLLMLPSPQVQLSRVESKESLPEEGTENETRLGRLFSLPAARSKGAKLLFFVRFCMSLAFHVFMTIWTVSLRKRFDFGPKEHAQFFGWIGLCYAASQGFAASLIKKAGKDPTNLLLICVVFLGIGRIAAMGTTSLVIVYIIMALVIVALGVMNTAITTAVTRLADADEVGGLIGVMESVESSAGLIGGWFGGLLFKFDRRLPLATVVMLYAAVFVAISLFYRNFVVNHKVATATAHRSAANKKED